MPRQARLDAPGALHHTMVRGIDKTDISKQPNVSPLTGTKIPLGNVTNYLHSGLSGNARYYYIVTADSVENESVGSMVATAVAQ